MKEMIGLPIDEETQYRALEDFYHSWCSKCVNMTEKCRIVDCMLRGPPKHAIVTGNCEYGD